MAGVCCDSSGRLIDGFAQSIKASSAAQAEAQAMVETLRYFSTRTEVPPEVESDHSDLISALICGAQITWEVQGLIKQAHSLLKAFKHKKLAHIKRESNGIADWIVRAQRKKQIITKLGYSTTSSSLRASMF